MWIGRIICISIWTRRRAHPSSTCSRRRCSFATRWQNSRSPAMRKRPARAAIHVYIPIVRGPDAESRCGRSRKHFSIELAQRHPKLITAEYRVAKRPAGHVLVDYNQNAWNRTLASVYSVRPKPRRRFPLRSPGKKSSAASSIEDFTMKTCRSVSRSWAIFGGPCWRKASRANLERFL